jgi:hypothetical protein
MNHRGDFDFPTVAIDALRSSKPQATLSGAPDFHVLPGLGMAAKEASGEKPEMKRRGRRAIAGAETGGSGCGKIFHYGFNFIGNKTKRKLFFCPAGSTPNLDLGSIFVV